MTDNIKMAATFELPLSFEKSMPYGGKINNVVFDKHGSFIISIDDYDMEDRVTTSIVHAVNNHDRLVEENERLKKELAEAKKIIVCDDCGEQIISYKCDKCGKTFCNSCFYGKDEDDYDICLNCLDQPPTTLKE